MRFSKRIITLLAATLAFAMLVPTALAVNNTSAVAGNEATLIFTFKDVYNVDGAFTVDDPQKILSAYSINVVDAGSTAALVNGNRLWASPSGEPVKTTLKVSVEVTLKSNATTGAYCIVAFSGIYGDANEEPGNEHDVHQSATVTVKAVDVTPVVTPTPSVSPTPSVTPTPTPTPPTTPAVPPTTPTPSTSPIPTGSSIDYSELQKQINIASGLIESDYTNESRDLLANALSEAKNALNSKNQDTVAEAAEKLRTTIAGLVSMDYSELKAALTQANALLGTDQTSILWQQLSESAEQGNQLLQSGDQQAVDQAADQLTDILARIVSLLEADPETKVVVQEVPVEVLPSGDYCNITVHHVWPVLFIVSAALNVALIGVIVAYIIKKTKNRKDDTPLVDYDIDDDF